MVRTLIKHGTSVLAVDVEASGVEKHFDALREVIGFAANIRNEGVATQVAERASRALGGIDILVCNVDIHPDKPLTMEEGDAIAQHLERRRLLMTSLFDAALPQLKKSPAGRVINIGCLRSEFAADAAAGFAHAEHALAAMTRAQAAEIGDFGITSNYIQPGAIMTPAARRIFTAQKPLRDHCIAASAAKRLGEPVDVAKVALFLATDESAFVSGTGIVVDGCFEAND